MNFKKENGENQPIEVLELSPRAQEGLREQGVNTLGDLRILLLGRDSRVSFLKIQKLGEVNRIAILRKVIKRGLITTGNLGKYCKNSMETNLWECYRTMLKDYQRCTKEKQNP